MGSPFNTLTFFYCDSCGAMSMKNFRGESCLVCHVIGKVWQVEIYAPDGESVEVRKSPAP